MSKHSEQVMKQRAKLKRVEVLFRPEDFAAIRAAADKDRMTVAAYIKHTLKLESGK